MCRFCISGSVTLWIAERLGNPVEVDLRLISYRQPVIAALGVNGMKRQVIENLLVEAFGSPVFGDSFDYPDSADMATVAGRVEEILGSTAAGLAEHVALGMPELDGDEVSSIVWQIVPKSVCFCPALAAADLDDTRRLSASAIAIGLMYWADQTMDRGDDAMLIAIELFSGCGIEVPDELAARVQARLLALRRIEQEIRVLAQPEDVRFVLACFREQVLLNEARLRRISLAYQNADDQRGFLVRHAREIAHRMVVDAGFPSVSSTLYAIYRNHFPQLSPLADIYAEPELVDLLQVCNSVVRVADELGDWEIDAGYDPAWGSFTVNLFNQSHPALLRAFLEQARVRNDEQVEQLLRAFARFRESDDEREEHGEFVLSVFFDQARRLVGRLARDMPDLHPDYLRLCKRVLEIGYVNRVGDIVLAAEPDP